MQAAMLEKQAEQLSQLIDEMNKGKQLETPQGEMGELVRLASMLRQAAGQEAPPTNLIAQTVGRLADKPAKASPKRSWLHMAVAGTAAVVFLALAQSNLQWTTDLNDKQLAQVPITPPMVISVLPAEVASPPAIPEPFVPAAPSDQLQAAQRQVGVPLQVASQDPIAVANDQPTPVAAAISAANSADTVEQKPKTSTQQSAELKLLGRQAYSTVQQAGRMRQVYSAGQADELVIIQQLEVNTPNVAMRKAAPLAASSQTAAIEKKKADFNEVTVVVKGREIIIQGRKPAAELQMIASQLVEEE